MQQTFILTVLTFLPVAGTLALLLLRSDDHIWIRRLALVTAVAEFAISLLLLLGFDSAATGYQFEEFHAIRVHAPRERVFQAIKEVRADEIFLFRTLTWIRRFGRPGPESILNAPENMPLLEVATKTSFLLLAEEPDREIVLGTLVAAPPGWRPKGKPTSAAFRAFDEPGFALAATNFRLEDSGAGETIVTTETRVYATDASTRRKFAAYWRTIYPGSALIRVTWLRAIRHRAEQTFR